MWIAGVVVFSHLSLVFSHQGTQGLVLKGKTGQGWVRISSIVDVTVKHRMLTYPRSQ